MKKELSANERAKRGIPSIALMENRDRIHPLEGFDSNGYLWLYIYSDAMRPLITSDSFVALQRVPTVKEVIKGQDRMYLFVLKGHNGDNSKHIRFGYVVNNADADGYVLLKTIHPVVDCTRLCNEDIVEQYRIMFALRAIPCTLSFKETLKENHQFSSTTLTYNNDTTHSL